MQLYEVRNAIIFGEIKCCLSSRMFKEVANENVIYIKENYLVYYFIFVSFIVIKLA